jgi:hypothetical protein
MNILDDLKMQYKLGIAHRLIYWMLSLSFHWSFTNLVQGHSIPIGLFCQQNLLVLD